MREVKGTGDMLKSFFCRKLLPFLQSCSWIWKRIACDYTNAGPKIVGNPPNAVCMHHLEPPLGCNREDASVKKTYFFSKREFHRIRRERVQGGCDVYPNAEARPTSGESCQVDWLLPTQQQLAVHQDSGRREYYNM